MVNSVARVKCAFFNTRGKHRSNHRYPDTPDRRNHRSIDRQVRVPAKPDARSEGGARPVRPNGQCVSALAPAFRFATARYKQHYRLQTVDPVLYVLSLRGPISCRPSGPGIWHYYFSFFRVRKSLRRLPDARFLSLPQTGNIFTMRPVNYANLHANHQGTVNFAKDGHV